METRECEQVFDLILTAWPLENLLKLNIEKMLWEKKAAVSNTRGKKRLLNTIPS